MATRAKYVWDYDLSQEEFDALLSDPTFAEQVAAHLPEGAGRREMLIATLRRIAGL